jgi:hypothetical protein
MEENLISSSENSSDMEPTASPTLRQDTYLALNLLTPSELEWLMRQRLRVAAAYGRSDAIERLKKP